MDAVGQGRRRRLIDEPLDLEAGEQAGVQLPFGCRMGICMGCVVPLESGAVRDLREVTAAARRAGAVVCVAADLLALRERLGQPKALAEGAVRRAGNRVPDIDETQAHVHLVLELYWALLQQSQPARAQRLTLHP